MLFRKKGTLYKVIQRKLKKKMMVEPSTLWKKSRPDKSEFWHVKDLHVIQAQAIAIPIIAAGTQVSQ